MSYLQNGGVDVCATVKNSLFDNSFCITRKQERCITVDNTQHNRCVVGVAAVHVDSQDSASGTSQGKAISRGRNSNRNSVLIKSFNEIAKGFCVIRGCRAVCSSNRSIIQSTSQTANVVFVSVSTNNIIQVANVMVLEIGVKQAGIFCIAAVNQHGFTVTKNKGGICLSNIYEVDFKSAVLRCNRRLSCGSCGRLSCRLSCWLSCCFRRGFGCRLGGNFCGNIYCRLRGCFGADGYIGGICYLWRSCFDLRRNAAAYNKDNKCNYATQHFLFGHNLIKEILNRCNGQKINAQQSKNNTCKAKPIH